jgi:putative ABC transport system substrate-binding protein
MQLDRLKRREFIAVVGGAAAWPLAAGAQQVSGVPRIGYLSPGSASSGPLNYYDEFRRELRELGYIEGQNIVIDYRFADGKFDDSRSLRRSWSSSMLTLLFRW